MGDYSAFYDQQNASLVQRATKASSGSAAASSGWEEMELDLDGAPATPRFDTPRGSTDPIARASGPGPAAQARGYTFRIACDRVECGEWEGRAELGVLDDSFVQLVLEDHPPIGVSLGAISAVQLSIVGADAETAASPHTRTARKHGKGESEDRLAGLSDFARQQAAMAPQPPPDDLDSSATAPTAALTLSVRLDMELEVPLEPDGA